jgi:hypothetical protein
MWIQKLCIENFSARVYRNGWWIRTNRLKPVFNRQKLQWYETVSGFEPLIEADLQPSRCGAVMHSPQRV